MKCPKFNGKFYDWDWFFYKRLGYKITEDQEQLEALWKCIKEIQDDAIKSSQILNNRKKEK